MEFKKTKQPKKTAQQKKYTERKMIGNPEYCIREDHKVSEHLIQLFLHKIEVNEQVRQNFRDYIKKHNLKEKLSFPSLMEMLEEFRDSSEEAKQAGEYIMKIVKTAGILVLRSLVYRKLFSYLPRLVPKQFVLMMETAKEEDLDALEEAIDNDPYVFGFAPILRFKYHQRMYVEASLENMQKAGLFDRLSICHKDALVIYNAMKHESKKHGHTYSRMENLEMGEYVQNLKYEISRSDLANEFLVREWVIVKERHYRANRLFLRKLWLCENGIADNLAKLIERHEEKPLTFDVDFDSEEFSGITKDAEQMKVAEAIGKYPVVIVSGKGGCGKTTIVSATLNYAKRIRREEVLGRQKKMMEESEELDDLVLTQQVTEMEKTMQKTDGTSSPARPRDPPDEINKSKSDDGVGDGEGDSSQDDSENNDSRFLDILLAAPTGKAASVLKRRSKLSACTLHTVKLSYNFWSKSRVGTWRFAGVEVLVVDESSMVSVSIFHDVLSILMRESKLIKVILLGDIRQLPSIDPGNFLEDVFCSSFSKLGVSIELLTSHRTDSNSKLIIDNATRISNQQIPVFDSERNFHHILYDKRRGVIAGASRNVDVDEDASCELDAVVKSLLQTEECLKCDKKSQIISFKRSTCANLNEICCKRYQNHTTRDSRNKLLFITGDKVACNRNGNVENYLDPPEDANPEAGDTEGQREEGTDRPSTSAAAGGHRPESNGDQQMIVGEEEDNEAKKKKKNSTIKTVRLCNGEIYFMKEDHEIQDKGKKTRFVLLDDEVSQQVKVNFRRARIICKIRHAWANTIHKFQGSEADTIVYIVSSCGYENWQHVYTAVTRGKKQVYIVSRPGQLEAAIGRNRKFRRTTLKEKLDSKLKKWLEDGRGSTQSANPSQSQTQFPRRLSAQKLPAGDVSVSSAKMGSSNATTDDRSANATADDRRLKATTNDCGPCDLVGKEQMDSAEPVACNSYSVASSTSPNFEFTRLKSKCYNSETEYKDESQTFSDWGESMCQDIDAMVAASQAVNTSNVVSNTSLENMPSHDDMVVDDKRTKVQSQSSCRELFPPRLTREDGNENCDIDFENEKPLPFAKYGGEGCSNGIGEVHTLPPSPADSRSGTDMAAAVDLHRGKTKTELLPDSSTSGSYSCKAVSALPISTEQRENSEDHNQVLLTPIHPKPVCEISPDLFSPTSPQTSRIRTSPSSYSTPGIGSQKPPINSPKRPGSPVGHFTSPKVRKLAVYEGFCFNCLSPIRKGVDMITIEEKPKRQWIHEQCSPNKSS